MTFVFTAVRFGAQTSERLGSVSFPTSCAADVQKPFERAVSLLHSFVYEDAEAQFEDVFKKDPHCAIALWGEAMSIYYPLWFQPSTSTIQHGRELIERAQKVGAKTKRERGYIDVLATFYQGPDTAYEARTEAYAHAMQNLAARYPDDHEAAIFYALALLGATPPKEAPLSNRNKAAEILRPLYDSLPNHPGVTHYLIHVYDTPSLAQLGLPMARHYSEIAPSAPHAVHMPAHIFTLLGLWQEDIDSNLAAEKAGQQSAGSMSQHHILPLHFLDFLSYAYLQVGREDQTQEIIEQLVAGVGELPPMMQNHARLLLAEIPARYTLDLRRWSRAASLKPPDGAPRTAQAITYWARAIGAVRSGNLAQAREGLHQFEEVESATGLSDPVEHAKQLEASAWVAHIEGADDKAIAELREANQLQQNADTTAHDWMGASAREMLADLLLELNRPSEALSEYQAALHLTPNRFDALYGAARSAAKVGKPDDAAAYYAQIQKNCQGSSQDRPELAEAKEFLQVRRQHALLGPAPYWHTLATEAYPKKRDDIVFADALTGFYGTGKGKLYRTQDGGQSWRLIWSKPGTFIRSLGFIDARHGFLGNLGAGLANITDTTPLYETKDGGVTWEAAKIGSTAIPGVCSIDILKSRAIHEGDISERYYVHAAGRANGPAEFLRSEDGGKSWALIDLSDRAGMILDVKFFDPNIGFVFAATSGDLAQSNALILKTTDGGRTWRQVYRSTRLNEIIWKASFPDNLVGYASVQNNDPENLQQRVVKTVDGGEHWSEIPLVTSKGAEELGIGFVSPDKGWVGTSVGGFETSDGGRSWKPSDLAPKANKIRVRAADGTPMIYAIGSEVQIYR